MVVAVLKEYVWNEKSVDRKLHVIVRVHHDTGLLSAADYGCGPRVRLRTDIADGKSGLSVHEVRAGS